MYPLTRLFDLELKEERAHGGTGLVETRRVFEPREGSAGGCHFVDYVELPPDTSVGEHQHSVKEQELYLVLSGTGRMQVNGDRFDVGPGDLVINPPGALHGLVNTGRVRLQLLVVMLSTGGSEATT